MVTTSVGLFDGLAEAMRAVEILLRCGFSREDLSIVTSLTQTAPVDRNAVAQPPETSVTCKRLQAGDFDDVFGQAQTRSLPGIGWVALAGPLLLALSAGRDTTADDEPTDLVAALATLDIADTEAEYYAEATRRGGTLLAVTAESHLAERAEDVLLLHGAIDLGARVWLWQQQGWQRFSPTCAPYTPSDLERDRYWQAHAQKPGKTWTPYERDFRSHFYVAYTDSDLSYESYAPAYCRGYSLAASERYQGKTWDVVEADIRCDWERHSGKAWVTVVDAVRYGFLKWQEHIAYRAR